MTKTIHREILISRAREQIWRALTDSTALAERMLRFVRSVVLERAGVAVFS